MLPIHRGENRSYRGCSWEKTSSRENLKFLVLFRRWKKSAICLERKVRNVSMWRKKEFKLHPANCLCLKRLATTDSSMVARVSMMLLAILNIQVANHIPMGMMLLCAGVGYLPPWEYYQNNWGWGCAESGWGCTWTFNQLTWWDYNAYFRGPPPESCNWFDIQSSDANIKHRQDALPDFWPLPLRLLLHLSTLRWLQVHRWACGPRNHHSFYLSGMLFKTNEAHRLLPLLLLSVSFSLPANLSFFLTLMPK